MSNNKDIKISFEIGSLRKYAEEKVRTMAKLTLPPDTSENVKQMFHELQVHQIELEMQNDELRLLSIEIEEMKNRYFDLYNMAPVGYAILDESDFIVEANLTLSTLFGVNRKNLIGQSFSSFIHYEDKDSHYLQQKQLFKRYSLQGYELRLNKPGLCWVHVEATTIKNTQGVAECRLVVSDITSRKVAEASSLQNLERFRIAQELSTDGFTILSPVTNMKGVIVDFTYVYENSAAAQLTGTDGIDVVGRSLLEVIPSFRDTPLITSYMKVAQLGVPLTLEAECVGTTAVKSAWFRRVIVPMGDNIAILTQDLSERKQSQEQLLYEHEHDFLTGLYNRGFLEKEQKRLDDERFLPLSLIIADTNGLKLINDSFGHSLGDEVLKISAQLLRTYCRPRDIVVRYGGDEFIILLPNTSEEETQALLKEIEIASRSMKIELIQLSLAFGYDTRHSMQDDIETIFKKAEDMMYRNKLYQSSSAKSKTINLVMNSLFAKSHQESLHSKRVSALCEFIAHKLNMSPIQVNRMRIAGLMHDIGKIGISESILNKEGPIIEKEWIHIKRHPEIGSRILAALDEFVDISEAILEHHERWDGGGYPRGIKGEFISLQARIITVADSFDAMTSERSYKDPLSTQEAIDEIVRCSGTQFDPHIADVFVTHHQEFMRER